VTLGGKAVDSMNALIEYLLQKNVGDKVVVGLIRGGAHLNVTVTLAARPAPQG
jgi:S1-C subfamily serine protease